MRTDKMSASCTCSNPLSWSMRQRRQQQGVDSRGERKEGIGARCDTGKASHLPSPPCSSSKTKVQHPGEKRTRDRAQAPASRYAGSGQALPYLHVAVQLGNQYGNQCQNQCWNLIGSYISRRWGEDPWRLRDRRVEHRRMASPCLSPLFPHPMYQLDLMCMHQPVCNRVHLDWRVAGEQPP